ncbi:hypothetical protein E2562_037732 [Oryza meyeriana var. granulata]|uniref:Uncharacterized protein n=1 Tax=Oryza meyeriana var. granulata TaxID=110450 RepID=A0A6G1C2P9_9ORYZ|nr:hypothetical protein E2562_037732 [Oryza meyeriana var. granulata]
MAHQNHPAPRRVPHVFSNEPGNYVATTAVNSVFLVEAVLRHLTEIGDDDQSTASYYSRCEAVYRNLAKKVLRYPPQQTGSTSGSSAGSSSKRSRPPSAARTSDESTGHPSQQKGVTMGITIGEEEPTEYCAFGHPPIPIAPRPPQAMEEVVLRRPRSNNSSIEEEDE